MALDGKVIVPDQPAALDEQHIALAPVRRRPVVGRRALADEISLALGLAPLSQVRGVLDGRSS